MADAALQSVDDLDVVVDGDAHVSERIEDLLPYMDDRHGGIRRIVGRASDPGRQVYSSTYPTPGFADRDYTRDANDKLADMEEFGIDRVVLTPTMNLNISTVGNTRFAVALTSAYNSWLLDAFLDDRANMWGTILVPPQAPERAAEEIDRRADEGDMVGVFLPGTGTIPPLGHPWYDPVYEAAADHDLPVVIHASIGAGGRMFPTQRNWNETYAEDHAMVHPFSHMWNITTMLFRGVPERFPGVEFVFQEAGIGWIPYLTWRLDDHYLEFADELPYLDRLPSSYLDRFRFTTQPLGHTAENPEHLARMVELVGPERLMYSADLPHKDFDPPWELFDRIAPHFDPELVRGIMGETAVEFYDL